MPQTVTSWTSNWNITTAYQDLYNTVHQSAVLGFFGGAWAGGVTLGPGGLIGGAATGAAGGILVGLAVGINHAIEDVIQGTRDGTYTWVQRSDMNIPAFRPLTITNNSDGSVTHNFLLPDNTRMSINPITKITHLYGTGKVDEMVGVDGNDYLHGGAGNDIITGHQRTDRLYGDAGNDRINGGSGDDRLIGGLGVDTLTGGSGADYFYFNKTTADRDWAYFDPAQDWVVGGAGFHITKLLYDTDARGIHRITDIYLTGDNHLHLQRGDGGDGRYGMGYDIWTPAEAEAVFRNNPVHDFFDA